MPKVTKEYLENKRRMILEAAYKVCLRKPIEMVTISDVISETGMSQGAIYRYYGGLDEILTDIATKMRAEYNIIDDIKEVISDDTASVEELVYKVFDCLAVVMERHLMDIQKFNFDFGVLAINEPLRAAKIMKGISGRGNMDFLAENAFPLLIKKTRDLGYSPVVPDDELREFIKASYAGIEKYCILSACYGTGSPDKKAEPRKLFRTLATSVILLSGGKAI